MSRPKDENAKVEIKQKIIQGLLEGLSKTAASENAGIEANTCRVWLAKDPVFNQEYLKARAEFARKLIPLAIDREPFKMLKSMYPQDYSEDAAIQVNIDNRHLIAAPSSKLLELLDLHDNANGQEPSTE